MPVEQSDIKVMDPTGVVEDAKDLTLTAQGEALARFMHATLDKHFHGWRWGVTVDEKGGVAHVFAMELSGDMGYTLLIDDLWNGGNFDWKLILVAGGEILERFGCPRGAKRDDWQSHVTWHQGIAIPDVTDKKAGLIKHLQKRTGTLEEGVSYVQPMHEPRG